MRYYLLHKPRGCVTSTVDDTGRGRPTVYDVARAAGIFDCQKVAKLGVPNLGPVGRLDFDTSGVLLFMDDHKLKKAISSPNYKGRAKVGSVPSIEKVYHALVAGTIKPDDKGVDELREPLHLTRKLDGPEGVWTKPAEARVLMTKTFEKGQPVPWRFKPGTPASITWIELVLREGKNRQIRRLCRRSEYELTRLHRVSVGPIVLGDLKESCCRELTRGEVKALYKRCLPEDPLCPTVREVEDILRCRLLQTSRRLRQASSKLSIPNESLSLCHGGRGVIEAIGSSEDVADGEHDIHSEAQASTSDRRIVVESASFLAEDLSRVTGICIDFARRDLHEAPEGADGEWEKVCVDEERSLARARTVPPNEAHMICGYRKSQIERLGLEYSTIK